MRKKIKVFLGGLILIFCLLSLTGCSSEITEELDNSVFETIIEESTINYITAEDFEKDLNNGVNVDGKIVKFILNEYKPDSVLGYNSWAGEHLNFISKMDLKLDKDDQVIGKVISVRKSLGSWVIDYEVLQIIINDNVIAENIVDNSASTEEKDKQEVEAQAKKEAEEKARQEAEAQAKKEAEEKARQEAEAQAKKEAEEKARQEAEIQVKKQTSQQTQTSSVNNSRGVYRTPSGKRYHFDPDCGGKNSYSTTLDSATSAGLTPCQKCAK